MNLHKALCWLGLHNWEQSRPLSVIDTFPPPGPYDHPTRHCTLCPKNQRWLPGYGGSEFGCWLEDCEVCRVDGCHECFACKAQQLNHSLAEYDKVVGGD